MSKRKSPAWIDAVTAGELWAVPLPKLGYHPLVVARAPGRELDFALAYLNAELSEEPVEEIAPPQTWKRAWVGLVPTLPFRKGRWVRCGMVADFEPEQWPLPSWRESAVQEDEPTEDWGKSQWGEMWTLETTLDEPSMTLLANTAVSREQALRFPSMTVVTSASAFEKSLVHYAKGRRPCFWDMHFDFQTIKPGMVEEWYTYGRGVRGSAEPLPEWLPAGRTTDRELQAGSWMGIPLTGGGFGAALLIEKPAKHHRLFSDAVVMTVRRRWDRWPTLDEVVNLKPKDGAIVAQTSMICVRDGRWRVLGSHPGFDPEAWVWPLPWWGTSHEGYSDVVDITIGDGESTSFRVDPEILKLDPEAGRRCSGSMSYSGFELDTARLLDGHLPPSQDSNVVTPSRLGAWRAINGAIRDYLSDA